MSKNSQESAGKNRTQDNKPKNEADSACACGCAEDGAGTCCESQKKCCCPFANEYTLAFWVLRLWLGFRALFTGFSKWESKVVGEQPVPAPVTNFFQENYGTAAANNAVQIADAKLVATQLASKATIAAAQGIDAAKNSEVFDKAYNAALPVVSKAITDAGAIADSTAAAVAKGAYKAPEATTALSHHGLPQGGAWTLKGLSEAEVWYMPKNGFIHTLWVWSLGVFDAWLGPILVALGITLLLGIGTRISLFLQGLLYCGLTYGFIHITSEPGSSSGITMLGVHVALVAAALVLSKHNKFAVLKKF